jgi:peptide/nickel transport system substrate-binding protein
MTYDEILEYNELDSLTGSGPFKAVDFALDEYMIVEAFDEYWGGHPVVDKIIYQAYASDDARVQALHAGEVDFIDWAPYTGVEALLADDHLTVVPLGSFGCYNLIINSLEGGPYPEALNDPAVRRAIAFAIDKEQIISVAYAGYGDIADSIIPPTMGKWYNSELEQIPYDTEEGSRILEEAGYVDSDGDGVREDLDGNPMSYRLNANESPKNARLLEIISDGLAKIGIDAPPLLDADLDDFYPEYDFDILVWGWDWDVEPASALVVFTCDEVGDGGWNDAGYCNPYYDELYEKQAASLDPEERKDIIWEMQEIFYNDRAYVMLLYDVNVQAYNKDKFNFFDYVSISMLTKMTLIKGLEVLD